ncbi:iron-containing alcohol dehydrogenase family protein [Metasolibacillus sp. FSL H7-0170]|uniref:iron-containing alcohol dehydrogenase family protein n=1 Tax=Metasolibacillus TaxID=2703677 RepID=UPI000D3A3849|nr:iron-containing alcohol dehydrogenase family protein [Metasolibacillus fluoroglycofenilyticus]
MNIQQLQFESLLATKLIFGVDCVQQKLGSLLTQESFSKVFIATDAGILKAGIIDNIQCHLKDASIDYTCFAEVEPNPHAETVMKGKALYERENCQAIIAVGGGSAIDFAKCVSAVIANPGHILDYRRGQKILTEQGPKIIVLPTTVGTGAEVTSSAVITDPAAKRKYVVASPFIQPQYAMIDPALTYSLPQHIVAATGMDALVHAIESYVSLEANPLSEAFSLQAIRMLIEHLPASYANVANVEARAQIHLASTLAGFAFNYGKLGIVHSCSHPMSAHYNVPHGLANAIILPYVLGFNKIANIKKFAHIARMFDSSLIVKSDNFAAEQLQNLVHKFNNELNIPANFRYLNIAFTNEMIEQLALDALDDRGTFPFNPRKASKEDIIEIYKKVLL